METRKTDVGEIKKVISYAATLREIPVGESRIFEVFGPMYTGFYTAKARLGKEGLDFDFESECEGKKLRITRIS